MESTLLALQRYMSHLSTTAVLSLKRATVSSTGGDCRTHIACLLKRLVYASLFLLHKQGCKSANTAAQDCPYVRLPVTLAKVSFEYQHKIVSIEVMYEIQGSSCSAKHAVYLILLTYDTVPEPFYDFQLRPHTFN